MLQRIKDRFTAAIAWRADERIAEAARHDIATREEVRMLHQRMDDLDRRFGGDYGYMRAEFDRIAPQVAALEYRLEALRDRLELPEEDEESTSRRAALEHERARLRMELVSHYEERLRRLEDERNA